MYDELIRAISDDGFLTAMAITAPGMVQRAHRIHNTMPVATAALGRTLMAASMMGSMQKAEDGSVTLQIRGGGPLGSILAVSDAEGNARGYVGNPGLDLPEKYRGHLDVGTAVGTNGSLTVVRDLRLKEPYVGSIALVSGEIAEDITAYFAQSEQTPTACALGVLVDVDLNVKAAGGYLIQLLPGAPEDVIARIEAGIAAAGAVTPLLDAGLSARALLQTVLPDFRLEFLQSRPVEYRCGCSRQRVERALISLGADELRDMIDSGETQQLECQFCDTIYHFTPEEITALLAQATTKENEKNT